MEGGDSSEEDEKEQKEPPPEPPRFGWVQGVMVGRIRPADICKLQLLGRAINFELRGITQDNSLVVKLTFMLVLLLPCKRNRQVTTSYKHKNVFVSQFTLTKNTSLRTD